jgi:hypothetical protein
LAPSAGVVKVLSALCGILASSDKYDRENLKRTSNGSAFVKGRFEAAPRGDKGMEELAAALADGSKKVVFVCNADAMLGGGSNEIRWAYDALLLAGRTDSLIIAISTVPGSNLPINGARLKFARH